MIVQETPKSFQTIVVVLGCLPEVKGKSLLLKTAHTSDTGKGSEQELILMSLL